jgi:hypothetical protein
VTGLDGIPEALIAVRDGKMLFTMDQGQFDSAALCAVFMYDQYRGFGKPKGNEKNRAPREGVVLMSELKKEHLAGWKEGLVGLRFVRQADVTPTYIKRPTPVVDWRLSSKAWCKDNGKKYTGPF